MVVEEMMGCLVEKKKRREKVFVFVFVLFFFFTHSLGDGGLPVNANREIIWIQGCETERHLLD